VGVFAVIGFIVVVIGAIVMAFWMEKKRTDAVRQLAVSNGFTFHETAPDGLEDKTGQFKLFTKGHSRKIRNTMRQEQAAFTVSQFDYSYTVGSGKNSSTHNQTVLLVETRALSVPAFVLGPENVFHRLGDLFGVKDIDFDRYPDFSRHYLLKGDDEDAVRRLFSADILGFFTVHTGYSIEGSGNLLLIYKGGKRLSVKDMEPAMQQRLEIFKLFWKSVQA